MHFHMYVFFYMVPSALFFFNDTATTEIYTLSLHDALPICGWGAHPRGQEEARPSAVRQAHNGRGRGDDTHRERRSEEHTSELQSRQYLVCRLLLEKKNILCCLCIKNKK